MHFLPFPWLINYNHAFRCNKSFTFIVDLISIEDFFFSFPWNYGIMYDNALRASNCISEWQTAFGIISRFYMNATSSWWKSQTSRDARSSWSWTPLNLVLLHFSEITHPYDFVASRSYFWWQTWNHLWRLLQN
jgi:hypothetical protein